MYKVELHINSSPTMYSYDVPWMYYVHSTMYIIVPYTRVATIHMQPYRPTGSTTCTYMYILCTQYIHRIVALATRTLQHATLYLVRVRCTQYIVHRYMYTHVRCTSMSVIYIYIRCTMDVRCTSTQYIVALELLYIIVQSIEYYLSQALVSSSVCQSLQSDHRHIAINQTIVQSSLVCSICNHINWTLAVDDTSRDVCVCT